MVGCKHHCDLWISPGADCRPRWVEASFVRPAGQPSVGLALGASLDVKVA